jgi:hypothetical protein
MAGLIIAGPWLTMIGSRVLARRASRPATLIAARRLADNPRAAFRAVSGLILALFVTSVAVGTITTIAGYRTVPSGGALAGSTLVDQVADPFTDPPTAAVPAIGGEVLAGLRSIRGVQGVTIVHTNPLGTAIPAARAGLPSSFGPIPASLVSCAQLASTPALGRCAAGAQAVAIPQGGLGVSNDPGDPSQAVYVWTAVAISAQRLWQLPVQSIIVSTNGSAAAIERAQTALKVAYPYQGAPATIAEMNAMNPNGQTVGMEQQLANVVIIVTLVIAGCTLAVSVAAGLSDRKRPFSLLRLTGAPITLLRRVVALESAVPLLVVAVMATGTGFLAAELFLESQLGYSLRSPGAGYYVIVLAGLAASLGIIAATLPLLNRITGPETARNE